MMSHLRQLICRLRDCRKSTEISLSLVKPVAELDCTPCLLAESSAKEQSNFGRLARAYELWPANTAKKL